MVIFKDKDLSIIWAVQLRQIEAMADLQAIPSVFSSRMRASMDGSDLDSGHDGNGLSRP